MEEGNEGEGQNEEKNNLCLQSKPYKFELKKPHKL
jgi:hypothetical protein